MHPFDFFEYVNKYSQDSMQRGCPPISIAHPLVGIMGQITNEGGFEVSKGFSSRQLNALIKDENHFRANPGSSRWKNLARKNNVGYDKVITSWGDILLARQNGGISDTFGYKANQTTVASMWSHFARSTGIPGAAAYTNNPGAVMNSNSEGAWPMQTTMSGSTAKYLLNVACNHATGTNLVIVSDLLVAIGNFSLTSTATQSVTTQPSLTRYTDGKGVQMIGEITSAGGTGASNITVTYDGTAGTSRTTAATAMTISTATFRLQPGAASAAPMMLLQAGDSGVKKINSVVFSAAESQGTMAMLLYKPLLLMPTVSTLVFVERSIPSSIMGLQRLVLGSDSAYGFITFFVFTSGTSTGVQSYHLQFVDG
jgi:hypothetical protein